MFSHFFFFPPPLEVCEVRKDNHRNVYKSRKVGNKEVYNKYLTYLSNKL